MTTVRRFDPGASAGTVRALAAFRRRARFFSPWFRFPKDAGSTRFPGHAWEVVETR